MIPTITKLTEFEEIIAAKEDNKVVLVYYTASWCGPCKMIAPFLDDVVAAADPSKIVFYKVDVDDAVDIVHKAGVTVMPTFRAYNSKNPNPGKDYSEVKGAIKAKLQKLVQESIDGPADTQSAELTVNSAPVPKAD